jgi:hypothetical protein
MEGCSGLLESRDGGVYLQMACSYGMAYADDGVRHVVLECVDEVQEVAAVVVPACCVVSRCQPSMIDPSIHLSLLDQVKKEKNLPSGPRISSFKIPLCPWLAMSAIQIPLTPLPFALNLSYKSFQKGS